MRRLPELTRRASTAHSSRAAPFSSAIVLKSSCRKHDRISSTPPREGPCQPVTSGRQVDTSASTYSQRVLINITTILLEEVTSFM